MGQSFKCLVHLVIQSLADSTWILYWRKRKSFTIRNDQAKDGQESTFYMKKSPIISVRLLSLFWLLKGGSFKPSTLFTWPESLWHFFLFPRLKQMLFGNKYASRSSLDSAIYQCLQQIPKKKKKKKKKWLFICFLRLGKKVTKMCFSKGGYFEGL